MNKKKWLAVGNVTNSWQEGSAVSGYFFTSKEAAEEFAKSQSAAGKNTWGVFELMSLAKLKDNPTILEEVK